MKKEALEAKKEMYKRKRSLLLKAIDGAVKKVTKPLKKRGMTIATSALMGISTLATTSCIGTYGAILSPYPQHGEVIRTPQQDTPEVVAARNQVIQQYKARGYRIDVREPGVSIELKRAYLDGLNTVGRINDRGEQVEFGFNTVLVNPYNGNAVAIPNNPLLQNVYQGSRGEFASARKHNRGPYSIPNMHVMYRYSGWDYNTPRRSSVQQRSHITTYNVSNGRFER